MEPLEPARSTNESTNPMGSTAARTDKWLPGRRSQRRRGGSIGQRWRPANQFFFICHASASTAMLARELDSGDGLVWKHRSNHLRLQSARSDPMHVLKPNTGVSARRLPATRSVCACAVAALRRRPPSRVGQGVFGMLLIELAIHTAAMAQPATIATGNPAECQAPGRLAESAVSIPLGEAPGMKVKLLNGEGPSKAYLLTFSRHDEIASGLKRFARDHNVRSGTVSAIGAFGCTVSGWYDDAGKILKTRVLRGDREVTSLAGNIAWLDSEPVTHLHFSSADADGQVAGGHLVRGWVGPGMEVMVTTMPLRFERVYDKRAKAFVPALGSEEVSAVVQPSR